MSDHSSSLFIKMPFAAAGLAFTLWSVISGIAGIDNFRASSYLEAWQNQKALHPGFQADDSDYHTGLNASLTSLALTPYNSSYHITAADILMWRYSTTPALSASERQSLVIDIRQHYQTAIQQQPFWAYNYARYALMKAQFGEVDAEMMQTLQTADHLGPYESQVQHTIISLGLQYWPKLDATTIALTANAIDKSLSWDVNPWFSMNEAFFALSSLGLYKRQAELCPLLKVHNDQVKRMCASITKPDSTKAHR